MENLKHSIKTIIKFIRLNFILKYKTKYFKGELLNYIELKPKNFRYPYMSFENIRDMVKYIDNFSMVDVL